MIKIQEYFKKYRFEIIFFVLLALVLLLKLGSSSLWEPDEPRYAEAVREMFESGDFLTPHYNYEYRFDKPVLYYWLIAASFKVFGMNDFALRFPSALFSLLTILFIYLLIKRLYGRTAAYCSAIVYATLYNFIKHGRYAIPDSIFIFFITAGFYFFFIGLENPARSRIYMTAGYISIGLATITKSPIGLLIPLVVFFLYMIIRRDWSLFKKMHVGYGILIYSIIALPWFIYMLIKYKSQYFDYYVVSDHLSRFFTYEFGRPRPFYYYLQILLGDFLPWTPFMIFSFGNPDLKWKKIINTKKENYTFLLILWIIVVLVTFSISSTKLPHYIIPIYAPLAALTGIFIGSYIDGKRKTTWRCKGSIIILILTILGVGILLSVHAYQLISTWNYSIVIYLPAIIAIISSIYLVFHYLKIRIKTIVICAGICLLLVYLSAILLILPIYEQSKPVKEISLYVKSIIKKDEKIALYKTINPAVMYYVRRKVDTLNTPQELEEYLKQKERVFIITKGFNIYDFENILNVSFFELDRKIRYLPRFTNFYKSPKESANFELVLLSNKPDHQ